MKRLILFLLTACIFAGVSSMATAYDFGLTSDTDGSIEAASGQETSFSLSSQNSLWLDSSIGNTILELQASYTYSQDRSVLLEIDHARISGGIQMENAVLNWKAGRIEATDFSGQVFSHSGDGAQLAWENGDTQIEVFGLYTGLLQASSSDISMTNTDKYIQDLATTDPIPVLGPLGPAHIVEGLQVNLLNIVGRQSLVIAGIFQQDVNSDSQLVSGGERLHSQYGGLGFSGPLSEEGFLFYSVFGWFSHGTIGEDRMLAALAGGSINLILPDVRSAHLSLSTIFASGDSDYAQFREGNSADSATAFTPITSAPIAWIFTPQQSNLCYISGRASIIPFEQGFWADKILVSLQPTLFFRTSEGPISDNTVIPNEDALYLGTEADLLVVARITSDLGASLGAGIFFPTSNASISRTTVIVQAGISLTL